MRLVKDTGAVVAAMSAPLPLQSELGVLRVGLPREADMESVTLQRRKQQPEILRE